MCECNHVIFKCPNCDSQCIEIKGKRKHLLSDECRYCCYRCKSYLPKEEIETCEKCSKKYCRKGCKGISEHICGSKIGKSIDWGNSQFRYFERKSVDPTPREFEKSRRYSSYTESTKNDPLRDIQRKLLSEGKYVRFSKTRENTLVSRMSQKYISKDPCEICSKEISFEKRNLIQFEFLRKIGNKIFVRILPNLKMELPELISILCS